MSKNIPQLLKGFRDFGPDKMSGRLAMFTKIRAAFERFGFQPMETPALEYAGTLTGKYGAEEKLMYRFRDAGDREVALRYDLTVPLARFYADNRNDLAKPFKRYAIGPVWRADNPQAGRYREFYQCDVDCVGSKNALADAEVIAGIGAALMDLGIAEVAIRINNRKIIDGVLEILGISEKKYASVLRVLDKLDKIGEKAVKAELKSLGLDLVQTEKLFGYLGQSVAGSKGLQAIFKSVLGESKTLAEGVDELSRVLNVLEAMEIPNTLIDLKLARGLDYYTGTVCEVNLLKLPEFGSIAGGGRYDGLIGGLAGGKEIIPAVGMSIGLDRLIAALEKLDLLKNDAAGGVLVFNLDEKLLQTYLTATRTLRGNGVPCDFYFETDDLSKQFKYAEKKRIGLGIFIGEEEVRSGEVTLRDLTARKQWKVKAEKLVPEVKKAFASLK